jgi:hypothetical protein
MPLISDRSLGEIRSAVDQLATEWINSPAIFLTEFDLQAHLFLKLFSNRAEIQQRLKSFPNCKGY